MAGRRRPSICRAGAWCWPTGGWCRSPKLVFATGSQPLRLTVPGADLPGVHTFRDSRDVDLLLKLASEQKRVVVIGGGLLGLEAAYGLAKAGALVTLVHLMDRLMERQLDAPAAGLLKRLVEQKGIDIRLNASTKEIVGETRVERVVLADGTNIAGRCCDLRCRYSSPMPRSLRSPVSPPIAASSSTIGSPPAWMASTHLANAPEHRGTCYGLVEPAYEQAKVLADTLADRTSAYEGSVLSTNLKVSGVSVFSAGDFMGSEGTQAIVLNDPKGGTYKKLVVADGRLTGAILIGDTQDALWYLDLIRSGVSIASFRSDLMFGRVLAERKAA